MGVEITSGFQEDYWIGDSGASSHMVGEDKDLFAKSPIQGKGNAANATSMPKVCKSKMNVEAIPKQDKSSKGVLTVKEAKGMLHKLFSFRTAFVHDWKMYQAKKENGDIEIKLTHKHFEPIVFDKDQRFDDAILLAAKITILPRNLNLEGARMATLEGRISKEMLHQVTGHAGQQLMVDTAKYYGVNVTGVVTKCLSCPLEKIRQKNIPEKNESTSKNPGERMYLDMSSIKDESLGGRRHWAMLVDKATRCKHSFFLKKKSDHGDMVSSWLKGLQDKHNIQVKFIHCYNAGENKKLEGKCNSDGLGIIFLNIQQCGPLNRMHIWKELFQH